VLQGPRPRRLGWMGTGYNIYALKLGGTEDGRHQGGYIIDPKTEADLHEDGAPRGGAEW